MTREDWVRSHEFLRPLADLHARVDQAIAAAAPSCPPLPDWSAYAADFEAGVPLLASVAAGVDVGPIDIAAADVVRHVARGGSDVDDGMAHALTWLTRAAALAPLLRAFDSWRDDERWLRPYCPACGSAPAMAQLAGIEPGRQRLLSCGCCRTRWRYIRTTCPFCEAQSHRLASLGIDGEGGLRIDYCESCHGYLKTYNGEGHESVLLADWTSLHLDLAATGRGWRRTAASLYRLPDPAPAPPIYGSDSDITEEAAPGSKADRRISAEKLSFRR